VPIPQFKIDNDLLNNSCSKHVGGSGRAIPVRTVVHPGGRYNLPAGRQVFFVQMQQKSISAAIPHALTKHNHNYIFKFLKY